MKTNDLNAYDIYVPGQQKIWTYKRKQKTANINLNVHNMYMIHSFKLMFILYEEIYRFENKGEISQ